MVNAPGIIDARRVAGWLLMLLPALLLSLALSLAVADPSPARDRPTAESVAKAYGADGFHRVSEIRFTFNVQKGDQAATRKWVWHPRTDRVSYQGKDPEGRELSLSYARSELNDDTPELTRQVDRWFINDQYWLLFPLHLVWDPGIEVTNDGVRDLPIPPGKANRLMVKYPAVGGYTPGDVYELYLGEDHLLQQWVYRRGGSETPTRIATWEQHQAFGPLVLSLLHRYEAWQFRLWFTDVEVVEKGP